jgi:PAS domain S-box-containing protein
VKADRNVSSAIEKGFDRSEWMHKGKNGELVLAEITLVRVNYKGEYAVAGYIRDLTEQKAKEQLTKEVMEKTSTISAIFDATPDLIFCKDSESRITECNKSMENYFDIRKSDIIGKNDIEAFGIPSDLATEYIAGDKKIFREKQTIIVEEFIPTSSGKKQLFETIKSPLIQNGEVTGLVVMSRDITQRKEMARQQAEAEAASKAKSSFLATMSHEMRTPMNAIIGMTAIGKNSKDIERKDYALHKIGDAAVHLLSVINDVLDISKIEANKLELSPVEFNFERMLQNIANIINFRMDEKHQKFTVNVDRKIPRFVYGDDHRLSQVILNLLSNAVKFSPESGEIGLDVTFVNEQDGICEIRTEVSDNGIGITPEQQTKLFRAFQQAESGISRAFGGTGLGLSISKHIVELMGGTIGVESEHGKGSRFIFTIKVGRGTKNVTSMLAPGIKLENLRILVVDDEPAIDMYLKELFDQLNINCDTAADGFEAYQIIEEKGSYDIYFIDWRMPGMDGIELTRKIKAHDKDRPSVVVMISSADWAVIKDTALDAGVSKYLLKPLFSSAIIDCVNECLGLHGAADDEAPEIALGGRFAGKKLLVAEDVEINREIIISLLEDTGVSIDCAQNGLEAVEIIVAAPDKYDAILMDVQMPKMDGLEATRLIRALNTTPHLANLPIIAMTAHVFKSDIEECLKAGMNDHIGKPIDIDDVLKKLHKYLYAPKSGGLA